MFKKKIITKSRGSMSEYLCPDENRFAKGSRRNHKGESS